MTVNVFVRFVPSAGAADRVEQILRTMVPATRNEPGCRRYDLFESSSVSGQRIFCLVETYVDQDAVQAHRDSGHYKAYRASVLPLLEQPIEVTLLEALDAR